jgi:hypothetical protein
VINLLPPPGVPTETVTVSGKLFIAVTSLDLMLTTMQLNNAKFVEGKPEYHDALGHVIDTLHAWAKQHST